MNIGSKVITVGDFSDLKRSWGYSYPNIGDTLTVSGIQTHPKWGGLMLRFIEKPSLVWVCQEQFDGTPNFIEVLPKTILFKNYYTQYLD